MFLSMSAPERKMKEKHSYITIQFKPLPHLHSQTVAPSFSQQTYYQYPTDDGYQTAVYDEKPGLSLVLEPVEMIFDNFVLSGRYARSL